MQSVADTDRLVTDGIITRAQANVIEARARETMVMRAINTLLCSGILAATVGVIVWLQSPLGTAVVGTLALAVGALILTRGGALYHMFGNAAALIGMMIGGAVIKLIVDNPGIAGNTMVASGAVIALIAGLAMKRLGAVSGFVSGSILLMGVAVHLGGLAFIFLQNGTAGMTLSLLWLYAAVLIAAAGWFTDVRLVTALAIVPVAQVLDTSSEYSHAAYVFYSPEPTLSILQMSLLIAACLWLARRVVERSARHAMVLAVLAFIVANLCALVGSLWGDVVGNTLWGPSVGADSDYDAYQKALDAFRQSTLVISPNLYAVLWAIAPPLASMSDSHSSGNERSIWPFAPRAAAGGVAAPSNCARARAILG